MLSLLWSKFLFKKTGKSGSFHFPSLKGRHNFGERVLSIFLTKIMVAIFDFIGNGRLGEKDIHITVCGRRSKIRRGVELEE